MKTAASEIVTPPALQEWRLRHQARSQAYLSHHSDPRDVYSRRLSGQRPKMEAAADGNRGSALAGSPSCTFPDSYATPICVSLLDTLPAFMALSAVQNSRRKSDITVLWMDLAARFMAQAALEQYVHYGANGPDVLLDAFAWGFDANSTAGEGSDDWEVNSMFSGEEGEVPEWAGIRKQFIGKVRIDDDPWLCTPYNSLPPSPALSTG